jgi:peptidylprolyl isomerase domain and WD repeat-containing protein 1
MRYCAATDVAVSADAGGFIEYWRGSTLGAPTGAVRFSLKMDTDLYALARAKTRARSLDVARDGGAFAAFCADGRVRVWRLATGKLARVYDESVEVRLGDR